MHVGLAAQYAALWDSQESPPDVIAFVQQHSHASSSDKLQVLLKDQEQRWRTQSPLRVEDYLARLPELATESQLKLQLAIGEFQAQTLHAGETTPDIEKFTARFPDLGESLKSKLLELVSMHPQRVADPFNTMTIAQASSAETERIGRYRLVRLLGEGAFGRVWLGFDEELQRQVAIKVPTPERFLKPEDAEAYLAEARTVAGLDHAHIVPVYDVGRAADGSIYVVSKFIEGRNLAQRIKQDRPSHALAASLLAAVAQALHHAHQKRLIHRDIKPANILIEEGAGTPYVADFGLAIREDDYLQDGSMAGTPAYMSPEQARGEGHRLDGRSDIFSSGVVLYELLTGQRPFRGSTTYELLHQVISVEPTPLRELDSSIPIELERICLKALSKRASDRYLCASQLADDLLHWQQEPRQASPEVKVIPKGLRSFGADDADFFLELLPGPLNRGGLPESIQFWKTRIEATDPDETFSVGLIYGPSGCGKSSLVKAGLLPRLSQDVLCVYLEATLDETEIRILKGLRKVLPELPGDLGLVATFAFLRRREGKKVVIVLDQFEQWLHAHRAEQESELVSALRQCDGGHVQSIVMVRDDFWLAASRFMDSLDIPIVQDHNFATIDLFDTDHAEKVLTRFGQAFGKLPARSAGFSDDEKEFLSSVATGLAQDGKVVSVRLSLFAEMIKGKPWIPSTLNEVGGTEGIGVNFLEETFSSRTANPRHRLHQQAARAVLGSLLPEVGTMIKGHMRSHAELLDASGYQEHPRDFNELLRILDGEIRLITPTDPEGFQSDSGSDPGSKFYQLTHDYLVPSVREWLTRKQKETRRGRAELSLEERSNSWNLKPENRHLPSLGEFLRIRLFTDRKHWTEPQRKMMAQAGKVQGIRSGVVATVLTLAGFTGLSIRSAVVEKQNATRAEGLVDGIAKADVAEVTSYVKNLAGYRTWADPLLKAEFERAKDRSSQRLNMALALLPVDESKVNYLREQLPVVTPEQFPVVRDALSQHRAALVEPLWSVALDSKQDPPTRFQAACALATYSPEDERWDQISTLVAGHLVTLQASDFLAWQGALRPAKGQLIEPLTAIYVDKDQRDQKRTYATEALADYAADRPNDLFNLLATSNQFQFPVMFGKLIAHKEQAATLAQAELARNVPDGASEDDKEAAAERKANAAVALVKLGSPENVWPLLKSSPDPRVRSYIIHWLGPLESDPNAIVKRWDEESDVTIRRALVLMLGEFTDTQLPVAQRQPLIEKLLDVFVNEPDCGLHGAVQWLLRKWGQNDRLRASLEKLRSTEDQWQARLTTERRQWYVNSEGQTFAILKAGEILLGSPASEPDRSDIETQHNCRIGRRLAIATTEVTKAEFARFQKDRSEIALMNTDQWIKTDDSPQTAMTWYEATAYCNWLSAKAGIKQEEWCYEPNENGEYGPGMKAKAGYLELTGYRLPTEAEWEFACRANTVTSRYYGLTETLLPQYAWYQANGKNRAWPTASLKPNDFGLFDMLGNAFEWCDDLFVSHPEADGTVADDAGTTKPVTPENRHVLRGGAFYNRPVYVRSAFRYLPDYRVFSYGFRPARTLR
jgi:serine/threonine protein kinase/formylglycine-generating enzyme required for sulfatase activity